MRINTKI